MARRAIVRRPKRPGGHNGRALGGAASHAMERVVTMASARVIAGRVVVIRRASSDLPAPEGPAPRAYANSACLHYSVIGYPKDIDGQWRRPALGVGTPMYADRFPRRCALRW